MIVYHKNVYRSSAASGNINKQPDIHNGFWIQVTVNTSFGFYRIPGNAGEAKLPCYFLIDEEVPKKLVELVELPGIGSANNVLLDNSGKSFGAICIIINQNNDADPKNNEEFNYRNYFSPPGAALDYKPDYRYFWIDLHSYKPARYETNNPKKPIFLTGRYIHAFAHELAHSLNFRDEYPAYEFDIDKDIIEARIPEKSDSSTL